MILNRLLVPVALISLGLSLAFAPQKLAAQAPLTAEQDQQKMLDLLGITALRPGPSGDEKAPNHANYDESKATPFTTLPDPLVMADGKPVTTAAQWWHERRPEIVEGFEKYVYGRVPKTVPKVSWRTVAVDHEFLGFTPVTARELVGEVDNSGYPGIVVKIHMTVVTPAGAKGPVPVLMMFGRAGFPAPAEPQGEEMERVNAALKAVLVAQDPGLKGVFEQHPAWQVVKNTPFAFPQLNEDGDLPSTWQLVQAGWGFALLDPTSVQADNGAGLTQGIIGLVNKGQPRSPEDWGALRAWAWGASRGLDYLETDAAVNAKKVGIEGVSRYGKAALLTMAMDERFATVLVGSSGKGGATLLRRNFGEAVESLTTGEYYWMAGRFEQFGAAASKAGVGRIEDLPVDSNELIALCAPRPTFISYGIPEKGDAKWLDQHGSWMATVDAGRVFRFLGGKGLVGADGPVVGDWKTAVEPPMQTELLEGELAWRQHDGGHTDAPNMKWFLGWAGKMLK